MGKRSIFGEYVPHIPIVISESPYKNADLEDAKLVGHLGPDSTPPDDDGDDLDPPDDNTAPDDQGDDLNSTRDSEVPPADDFSAEEP